MLSFILHVIFRPLQNSHFRVNSHSVKCYVIVQGYVIFLGGNPVTNEVFAIT